MRTVTIAVLLSSASNLLAQGTALQVDWFQYQGTGHWYGVGYTPTSWTGGQASAESFNANLASVLSADEQAWLDATFSTNTLYNAGTGLWIGLREDSSAWTDGSPWDPNTSFNNYMAGEPNNSGEPFVHMLGPGWAPNNLGEWNDTNDSGLGEDRPLFETTSRPSRSFSWPDAGTHLTTSQAQWTTAADIDLDGEDEWLVANGSFIQIYEAAPIGWALAAEVDAGQSGVLDVAVLDFNTDGELDLVCCSQGDEQLTLLLGSGPLQFSAPSVLAANRKFRRVCAIDADGDGVAESALATTYSQNTMHLYSQARTLDWNATFGGYTISPAGADLNTDGVDDLIISGGYGLNVILSTPAAAGLADYEVTPSSYYLSTTPSDDAGESVAVGDFNSDGHLDVATSGNPGKLAIFLGDGSGTLGDGPGPTQPAFSISYPWAYDLAALDLDGDGHLDLVSAVGNRAEVMFGVGDGQLEPPLSLELGIPALSIVATQTNNSRRIVLSGAGAYKSWSHREGDCDGNGISDADEIAAGAPDCNGNGIPDECDATNGLDCDGNGNPDACDIVDDPTIDCNGNGVIDACEVEADSSLDCNGNGAIDSCEISSGLTADCNNNGIPDSCDLVNDPSLDANLNDVLDICEGPGRTWILSPVTGNWYATTDELTADAAEQQAQNWGGHLVAISDPAENDWIAATFGDATNPVWIGLTDFDVEGSFVWWNGEDYIWSNWAANEPDNGGLIGSDFTLLHPATGEWTDEPRTVLARGVVELVAGDCDGNGIPDAYEALGDPSLDCDGNGIFDTCDFDDPANNCNNNDLLDACEIDADPSLDCNGNGQLDACEIDAEPSLDCDDNGVLDACQIAADPSLDCDLDGVLDSCQIVFDAAPDCDTNGVLDTCQLEDPANDWDGSGVLDVCEGGAPVYCVGNLNATGTNGKLEAQGSPLIADNAFTLHGWDLPTGVPAYFVFSRLTGDINPFGGGLGRLCLGPPIRRFNPANGYGILFTSGTGEVLFTPDLGNLPQTPIAPGETLHFQLWHREFDSNSGNQTSNTSDAIEVMFR